MRGFPLGFCLSAVLGSKSFGLVTVSSLIMREIVTVNCCTFQRSSRSETWRKRFGWRSSNRVLGWMGWAFMLFAPSFGIGVLADGLGGAFAFVAVAAAVEPVHALGCCFLAGVIALWLKLTGRVIKPHGVKSWLFDVNVTVHLLDSPFKSSKIWMASRNDNVISRFTRLSRVHLLDSPF